MSKGSDFRQGLSLAYRLGVELVVATGIGVLMGYALDYYFETRPWFLAIGTILGGAAGCLNVYRAAMQATRENGGNDDNENSSEPKH